MKMHFLKGYNMTITKNLILASAAILISINPALAEKGGKHKSWDDGSHKSRSYNDDGEWRYRGHDGDDVDVKIVIGGDDRDIIRHHIREDAFRHCPPGLAKKNPPCVPPGQAKKWRVGYPLPHDVVFVPVPYDWGLRAPRGYQYVQVDKDVLLIAEAGHHVIDAVTLLSAVGN
jgi:hypothetical protein